MGPMKKMFVLNKNPIADQGLNPVKKLVFALCLVANLQLFALK